MLILIQSLSISNLTSTELRRQIHIQSEQKRRAQIKDGFEELRNELPACLNKKMSKVALLHRSKFNCI
jgi:sensor domain CHASE-containing protein